ncbi:hypothetical protein Q8A73_017268 [Channa argus]|nr:hypothetical protein Q8A73_017268 [Channa argus]
MRRWNQGRRSGPRAPQTCSRRKEELVKMPSKLAVPTGSRACNPKTTAPIGAFSSKYLCSILLRALELRPSLSGALIPPSTRLAVGQIGPPGPPEESHKAVARVHLYRGPSDRKKRRVPACASVGEGLSAHINVINRQYIC